VEEVIFVSRGNAEFTIDGQVSRAGSGETVLLTPRSWHSFRNVGTETLHVISVFASPEPLICYAHEADAVLVLGGSGEMVDAHRAKRT
jgi:mannose-6-phosphate isomerase-like protein (cupin superfamily)